MPYKPRPRLPSASSSMEDLDLPYNFRNQVDFNAVCDLVRSRSECFLYSKQKQDRGNEYENFRKRTVWDIKPPDFTLQLYQPKQIKRNSRESMIPGYNDDEWNKRIAEEKREKIRFEKVPLPKILQPEGIKLKPDFVTRFRIPDSYKAKLEFVKEGKFPEGPYKAPGPHAFRGDDFRPLEDPKLYGKPEFVTKYDHDPGNIILKSQGIDVLKQSWTDGNGNVKDGYHKQMITYRPPDPSWDGKLLIPKERYKKGRSAHSALMHRIEKQLPWCPHKDKIEPITRPDIFDYKTVDWLAVTSHQRSETTKLTS